MGNFVVDGCVGIVEVGVSTQFGEETSSVERGIYCTIGGITKGWGIFVSWIIAMLVDPVTDLRGRQDVSI